MTGSVPEDFEAFDEPGTYIGMLGPLYRKREGGRVTLCLPLERRHTNPMGTAHHGGLLMTLVDLTLGMNVAAAIGHDAPPDGAALVQPDRRGPGRRDGFRRSGGRPRDAHLCVRVGHVARGRTHLAAGLRDLSISRPASSPVSADDGVGDRQVAFWLPKRDQLHSTTYIEFL